MTQPTPKTTALTSGKPQPAKPKRVSVHGGHSGQFCNHAKDTLEAVVRAYIDKGFEWVGITEHMPPAADRFLYPDEKAAGLTAVDLYQRFGEYIQTGRKLQTRYANQICLFVGLETETYTGSDAFISKLIKQFKPDYLVGSLHHVDDHPFDLDRDAYAQTAEALGGINPMYERYFDQQYEMLANQKPQVVGHFDLIRMYDPDYRLRFEKPAIKAKIVRNLTLIRDMGTILDFNVSALTKGADEPYVTESILKTALSLEIPVVPGDDSHGVATVGANVDNGIEILRQSGFNLNWVEPAA